MKKKSTKKSQAYQLKYLPKVITLSVKNEQWNWTVLPLMESIWILLWLLILNIRTLASAGTPAGLKIDAYYKDGGII